MKKDIKYISLLVLTIAAVVLVELFKPKEIDWTRSYSKNHKIPFGNYVLYEMLGDIFPGQEIKTTYRTFYELMLNREAEEDFNYVFIGRSFTPSETDAESFAEYIGEGNQAFIAAEMISEDIAELFEVTFESYYPEKDDDDHKVIKLKDEAYFYEKGIGLEYIESEHDTLASFSNGKPVLVRADYGEGTVYFCSVPLAFTNYYMLDEDNHKLVAEALRYLPVNKVVWDEYYTSGRQESQNNLRVILSREPLKWAYFLGISGVLLFMVFEAKRKQRTIPVSAPPKNNSLEFAGIVGRLFYSRQNHRNLALKKINYFLDYLRTRYNLRGSSMNREFVDKLADKSGLGKEELDKLAAYFSHIANSAEISGEQLLELENRLEKLKKQL